MKITSFPRCLFLAAVLLLSACSTLGNIELPTTPVISLNGSTVIFNGPTSAKNARAFAEFVKENDFVTRLQITSNGGDVFGGMAIGNIVHQHKLDVEVHDYCVSSCANYIATAANKVIVKNNGLIGWHGGSLQPIFSSFDIPIYTKFILTLSGKDWEQEHQQYLKKWHQQEADFFQKVGVDQMITVIGLMPGFKERRDAGLFSYDVQTLKLLGLRIEFEDRQLEAQAGGERHVQIFHIEQDTLASLRSNLNDALREANAFAD